MLFAGYVKYQKERIHDILNISFNYLRELFYRIKILDIEIPAYIIAINENKFVTPADSTYLANNILFSLSDIKSIKDFPFHLRDELDNILITELQYRYAIILKENMEKK